MSLAIELISKLVPLYFLILLGWIAGRYLKIPKDAVARLLIYVFLPLVIIPSLSKLPLSWSRMGLSLLVFVICSTICLGIFRLTRGRFSLPARGILAFGGGNANSGYFGFPTAHALYGTEGLGLMTLASVAFSVYENTVGYATVARSRYSAAESARRILRMPALYAFAFVLLLKAFGVTAEGPVIDNLAQLIRGAYSTLGMMLVGLALAECRFSDLEPKFLTVTLAAKFLVWPAVVLGVLWVDHAFFGVLDPLSAKILVMTSALPMAANTVAFASLFGAEPEKSAAAVALSTALSLVLIPAFVTLGSIFGA